MSLPTSAEVSGAPRRRGMRVIVAVLAPLLVLVGLGAWALSSPAGSSPDDDYHLVSIWCGLGDRAGLCEAVPGHPAERKLEAGVALAPDCFAFHPNHSGACTPPFDPHATVRTTQGNWNHHYYPPLYYAVAGLFATSHVSVSVLAIRGFNAFLYVGLVTALFLLLPAFRRRALVWTQAVTMVPLGVFLIASDNPSSWAVTSAATLWLALVGYYETDSRWRRVGLGAVATIATVMGAGARADAALFCVMSVVVAVVLTARARPRFLALSVLPAALVVVAALLYLTGAQSQALTAGLGNTNSQYGPLALLWGNIIDLPSLYAGTLGTSALGWFDTKMPSMVWVPMVVLCGAAILVGIAKPTLRKRLMLAAVGAGLVVYPMVLLFQSHVLVGSQVQPRYVLPVLVIFVGVALYQDRPAARTSLRVSHLVTAGVFVAIANAVALHENVRRYVSGLAYVSPDLNHDVQWWWPGAVPSPMVAWGVGTLTLALGAGLAMFLADRTAETRSFEPTPLLAR